MRGMVEAVDSYFTYVRLTGGELRLFNHCGDDAVQKALRAPGQKVMLEAGTDRLFGLHVVKAAPPEAKITLRQRN